MRQDGMNAVHPVGDLGDTQINYQARQCQRIPHVHLEQRLHQHQHVLQRLPGGLIEIFMQAERHPSFRCMGAGAFQRHVFSHMEGQVDALHRAFDGGHADFTIALHGMTIACIEQRPFHADWQEQGRAAGEQLAIQIAPHLRGGGVGC